MIDETRSAYDAIAPVYAELFSDVRQHHAVDRALIAAFAETVDGRVADAGCGPGHYTAHLRGLGVDAFGVDLSPEMIAHARAAHPGVRFDEGTIAALDVPSGSLGGVLAWYSTIHRDPDDVPAILTEFHRVLRPGGHVLIGFFAGGDTPTPFDHKVTRAYRWPADHMAALVRDAGLEETARLTRRPTPDERPFDHVRILARKA
ncbi:class I SAM-dependent DNA methyltransferase [Actinomadura algeriensis]|uniref:SAM-dependent methyltransferase n=1 Tax=Actinomadura algeriensis TaxID=1679523 RepID=A0ABR9JSU8_9ACTN|nr:methyltransferase domain-containing protein [Actinomadura algeriensis]MBE1533651.1 SAM-dependent methyltransferase [Actinomadura algeriensis]